MKSQSLEHEKAEYERYYRGRYKLFERCVVLVQQVTSVLLKHDNVDHISFRIKDLDKCLSKLDRKYLSRIEQGERAIDLIGDLIGFRIVCHYHDQIPGIRSRLENAFSFSEEDVTDKTRELEERKEIFGYRALHILARFNEQRSCLEEYREFSGLRIEFQIKTIAQHAWAAVERTIGYNQQLAKENRRRFTALAAILEVVDREFMSIRDSIRAEVN